MTDDFQDRPTAALHRLLHDAANGGQAKVDALLALTQRTVFVVPWPRGMEGFRTLVNSSGTAALPIFTERSQLEQAARRYGWLSPDGSAPSSEIGSREALGYARQQRLAFVVVDIAAEHAIEIAREEFEPLLSAEARRESTGPFAGAGKVSSSLMRAVRPERGSSVPPPPADASSGRTPTPPPGSTEARPFPLTQTPVHAPSSAGSASTPRSAYSDLPAPAPARPPITAPRHAAAAAPTAPAPAPVSTASAPSSPRVALPPRPTARTGSHERVRGTGSYERPPIPGTLPTAPAAPVMGRLLEGVRMSRPKQQPSDELLDTLESLLRIYPEVEWGCIGSTPDGPTLGIRVDARVRQRLKEIADQIATALDPEPMAVVVLDDPGHFRSAKSETYVFYPWRRR